MDWNPFVKKFCKQNFKTQFYKFRLFPFRSPLLRECAQNALFSFPPATKMFQFTGLFPHCPMYSDSGRSDFIGAGFPIRKSTGQRLLAT